MKNKIFIFDWDGTLIDSAAKIVSCMQMAATNMQLQVLDARAVKNIIGLGLPEAIRTLYPFLSQGDVEKYRDYYSECFVLADQTHCDLFPGVNETLEALMHRGNHLAVATGKSRKGLERALSQRGWSGLFAATRCADETASKPHPMMLEEILRDLNATPADAVMIGDTEFDMAMAASLGMERIAVSYGAHEVERLKRYAPIMCVDNLVSILDCPLRYR